MLAIFGLLLVSLIFFFRLLVNFAQGLIGLGVNVNQLYLLIAFMLGTTFGMHLHSFLGYIVNAALGGYRTERMLVSLYAENEEDEVRAE